MPNTVSVLAPCSCLFYVSNPLFWNYSVLINENIFCTIGVRFGVAVTTTVYKKS